MTRTITASVTLAILLAVGAAALQAGGPIAITIDITGAVPSPIPGHLLAKVIGTRWDDRSLPLRYSMNNTLNPIPNPLGAPFLSVATAQAVLQQSMDQWNAIPTSYINMQITGTTNNPGLAGFDFVNEITFRTAAGFGAIASSQSTTLISDVTLSNGDHIDGDGDADVSSAITSSADVDGDGDLEFPAGFYKAGTILDNDVQFNTKVSNGLRFTTLDAEVDTVTRSVDLSAVAVHEFGHSVGLAHTLDNQISGTDGTGTSMFPFIDTGDPASELSQRDLGTDDIAWASYLYPEGSKTTGLAALQSGDVAFSKAYGLIEGEIRHGVLNQPIAGASVAAYDWQSKEFVGAAYSGTTNLSFNPANGGLFFVPDVAQAIVDGKYTIPVPRGQYSVGIEAVDGSPVAAANISFITQIGNFFGQHNFAEEFYNNNGEATNEIRPGQRKLVFVNLGKTTADINVTTNRNLNINPFGVRTNVGFINPPTGGFIYAVRVPASEITALLASVPATSRVSLNSLLFDTIVLDASVVPVFAKVMLTTGSINPDTTANIDLLNPLAVESGFVAQDTDFAPFFLHEGEEIAETVRAGIAAGTISDLFMVLQIPSAPFPGVSGQPPLIGLSTQAPILGRSYLSIDGGATFTRRNDLNFRFSMGWSEVP
jgi:hypothetical protein